MMLPRTRFALVAALATAACSPSGVGIAFDAAVDAAVADTVTADAPLPDVPTTTDAADDVPAVDVPAALDAPADDAGDRSDAGPADTASPDAPPRDAGSLDTGVRDAGPLDTGVHDAGPLDTGVHDAGAANACVAGGGRCVALAPGTCVAPNHTAPLSCGTGLGVECCLPATPSAAPTCRNTGTAREGWYAADGSLLCAVPCAGLTTTCQRVGTAAQGWYAASGHGCPPNSALVVHDATCM